MTEKHWYGLLCVLGAALPAWQILPWLSQHGLDLRLFFDELFSNRVSAFFAVDVIVSSVVLWVLTAVMVRRTGLRAWWAPVAANLLVGVSLGLPLLLYLVEAQREQTAAAPPHR